MTPILISLPYSPWSERAAWALDLRGIPYEYRRYQPVLGEPRLWWARRGTTGPASVPVLMWEGGVITDSDEIARWADGRGSGPTLFPDEAAVREWQGVAEQALQAGRALGMRRIIDHPDALMDLVPGWLRRIGFVARPVARMGLRRTLRKYDAARTPDEEHRRRLCEALDRVRAALAGREGQPKTLLGTFSYADITVAQTLLYVSPPEPPPTGVTRPGIRVSRASRQAFRDPDLADRYADLVAWRDALYEAWRKPRP